MDRAIGRTLWSAHLVDSGQSRTDLPHLQCLNDQAKVQIWAVLVMLTVSELQGHYAD
jgi:hypothetical protein